MVEPFKRDRLNAYVEPRTTNLIKQIQENQREKTGVRFTIGQAVDYVFAQYLNSQEENKK